jgi:signal transduction histidine kinase
MTATRSSDPALQVARTAPEPLPGISCPLVTLAVRRAEARLGDETLDPAARDATARMLAAAGLAVSQRVPDYVLHLVPLPPAALSRRVLHHLQVELVRSWGDVPTLAPPLTAMRYLLILDELRVALDQEPTQQFASRLAGPDAEQALLEVAHDIRSPLTSILLLADSLRLGCSGPVTDVQNRQLGLIYSAAVGLTSLADDAIGLLHVGETAWEDRPFQFSVTELLEMVHDITRPMAELKGLTLRYRAAGPDARLGRPLALRRALLNLTTNALKFTQQGMVEIAARETTRPRLEFSVEDTGPGLVEAGGDVCYRSFRRSGATGAYRFSSSGMGLAATRRLVESMGSTLRCDTAPGRGTRFWFEVELQPTDPL